MDATETTIRVPLPNTGDYAGVPVAVANNVWRQYHWPSGQWHRFKVARGGQRRYFLRNEARWLSRLQKGCSADWDGVPTAALHGLYDPGSCLVLVTEHLPGKSLANLLKQCAGDMTGYQWILPVLFEALVACHRQGIVHGDIKPSNLVVDSHQLFLIDFANAGGCGELISERPYRGFSPSYSLPWQQSGRGTITPLFDWYAFLVLLRILQGGGLAHPDWTADRPITTCFSGWLNNSDLPNRQQRQLRCMIDTLDQGESVTSTAAQGK